MILNQDDIKKYLPHREPFLFIDEVVEIDENETIHARKLIKPDEYFLQGHFPGNPIFPGVIIIEALGQASGILGFTIMNKTPEEGSMYYFVGADKLRFKNPVIPGDKLTLESTKISEKAGIWKFDCKASVEDKFICSAIVLCADRPK